MKINPYENLANAIIELAAKDYREALKILAKDHYDRDARSIRRECERFFKSDWFAILTDLDGEKLMQMLKAEV